MMEKDDRGDLTTQPIPRSDYGHLTNRANSEYDPSWRRPAGNEGYRYRRPDVVIVKDPTKPPNKNNISQVIEMKFPGDTSRRARSQITDYRLIGGPSKLKVYRMDDPCKCGDREEIHVPVPVASPAREGAKRPVPQRSGATAGDWAILIGLGLATVGLALLPLDGPAGEAAAGTATAAQWARMFGAAAAF